jgi:hypothetical protein
MKDHIKTNDNYNKFDFIVLVSFKSCQDWLGKTLHGIIKSHDFRYLKII